MSAIETRPLHGGVRVFLQAVPLKTIVRSAQNHSRIFSKPKSYLLKTSHVCSKPEPRLMETRAMSAGVQNHVLETRAIINREYNPVFQKPGATETIDRPQRPERIAQIKFRTFRHLLPSRYASVCLSWYIEITLIPHTTKIMISDVLYWVAVVNGRVSHGPVCLAWPRLAWHSPGWPGMDQDGLVWPRMAWYGP